MTFLPLCNNNVRAVITFGPGSGLEVFLRREVLSAPCLFQELHSHVLAGNLSGNHIPFSIPVQQCNPSQPEWLTDRLIGWAWERNVTMRGQKWWHFQSCPVLPFRRNLSPLQPSCLMKGFSTSTNMFRRSAVSNFPVCGEGKM